MNPSKPWDDYAKLQQRADRRKLDSKAWATDEQAEEFLNALARNSLKPDAKACEVWLQNLATNRAKKHRRRQALLHLYQHVRPSWEPSRAHDRAAQEEFLERVRTSTTPQEWSALWALARGEDYEAVAAAEGCTVAALKSKVSRCRQRLHGCCA
jgi:hypothetical protein